MLESVNKTSTEARLVQARCTRVQCNLTAVHDQIYCNVLYSLAKTHFAKSTVDFENSRISCLYKAGKSETVFINLPNLDLYPMGMWNGPCKICAVPLDWNLVANKCWDYTFYFPGESTFLP